MIYTLKELADFNDMMLNRGAPVENDGIGYNKPDYSVCCHYFGIPSYAMAYDIANRLIKYTETQKIADRESLRDTAKRYYVLAKDSIDKVVQHNGSTSDEYNRYRYNDVSVSIIDKNPDILFNVNGYNNDKAKKVISKAKLQRVVIEEKGTKFYLYRGRLNEALSVLKLFKDEDFDVTSVTQYLVGVYGLESFVDKKFDDADAFEITASSQGPIAILKFDYNYTIKSVCNTLRGRWNSKDVAWEIAKVDYPQFKSMVDKIAQEKNMKIVYIEDEELKNTEVDSEKALYIYRVRDYEPGRSLERVAVSVSFAESTYIKDVTQPFRQLSYTYSHTDKDWEVFKIEIPKIIEHVKRINEISKVYSINFDELLPYLEDLVYCPEDNLGYTYKLKQYVELVKVESEKIHIRLGKSNDINEIFVTNIKKDCDYVVGVPNEPGVIELSRKYVLKFNEYLKKLNTKYLSGIRGCFHVIGEIDPDLQRDDIKGNLVIVHVFQDLGDTYVFSVNDKRLVETVHYMVYDFSLKFENDTYEIPVVQFMTFKKRLEKSIKYKLRSDEELQFVFDFEVDTLLDSPFVYDYNFVSVSIASAMVEHLLGEGNFSFLRTDPKVTQEVKFEAEGNPFKFRIDVYPSSKIPYFIKALEDNIEKEPKQEYKVLLNAIQELNYKVPEVESNVLKDYINFEELTPVPWKFQIEGAETIINQKKVILGDPMGLGKTKTAVIASSVIDALKLIVCPKTLMLKWRREILNVLPAAKVFIVSDNITAALQLRQYEYVIINYERFVILQDVFYRLRDVLNNNIALFMDEAHKIGGIQKSGEPTAKWTTALLDFALPLEYVIPITGTPIRDKAKTFFNMLRIIGADDLAFSAKWYLDKWGYDKIDPRHSSLAQLRDMSKKYIIRHTDVKLEITKKLRDFVPVVLGPEGQRLYKQWVNEYAQNHDLSFALVKYNALKQALAYMKFKFTVDIVNDLLEQDKCVAIFTHYVALANKFADYFKNHKLRVGLMTNETKTADRDGLEKALNNKELDVIIATMGVGGEGLDFLGADVAIINDLGWKITELIQTEDRLDRMNREGFFNVIYTYAEDIEIEQYLYDIVYNKIGVIERILDESSNDNSLSNAITEFLSKLLNGESEEELVNK